MKSFIIATLVIVALAAGVGGYYYYDNANRDFTPWMSEPELSSYLKKFDSIKPAGAIPWENSHWLTAAEGRWHDGIEEYRIRYDTPPAGTVFVWRYYINMDQETFSKHIQELGGEGFVLVYHDSFKLPDGTRRYQAVWHKTGTESM
jgi:hypothetical protein